MVAYAIVLFQFPTNHRWYESELKFFMHSSQLSESFLGDDRFIRWQVQQVARPARWRTSYAPKMLRCKNTQRLHSSLRLRVFHILYQDPNPTSWGGNKNQRSCSSWHKVSIAWCTRHSVLQMGLCLHCNNPKDTVMILLYCERADGKRVYKELWHSLSDNSASSAIGHILPDRGWCALSPEYFQQKMKNLMQLWVLLEYP